jgi:C4-dicarboxylate transporter
MDIGDIQIGIDIATAISVVIAALTFFYGNIRENKKNREAELNEQKKTRSLRISEYKIEKITEIIYYLNEKIHKLVEIIMR